MEVEIPSDVCSSCNRLIKDLQLPRECVLVSVLRGEEVIIPRGQDVLQSGDTVITVTSPENEKALKRILAP